MFSSQYAYIGSRMVLKSLKIFCKKKVENKRTENILVIL